MKELVAEEMLVDSCDHNITYAGENCEWCGECWMQLPITDEKSDA